jgi:hypothetical protein
MVIIRIILSYRAIWQRFPHIKNRSAKCSFVMQYTDFNKAFFTFKVS